MNFIRDPHFFQHDRNLFSVGCSPGVELNHGSIPFYLFLRFDASAARQNDKHGNDQTCKRHPKGTA
jgi:hypothetical protein